MKKKENKEDQIKELETQVTCLYSLLKVEKESLYSREKEIRDLKDIDKAKDGLVEKLKAQRTDLYQQKDNNFQKYLNARETKDNYKMLSFLSFILNILLAIIIFFK